MAGDLYGVWAKCDWATEQLKSLHEEVLAFGKQPHPYTVVSQVDDQRENYVFRFKPAWPTNLQDRWGAIIGEVVHDLRSALDQLVCQFVLLNGGEPRKSHSFPVCSKEPSKGFAVATRYERRDKRGRMRYGPLFGVSDDALTLIESCQPYKGGNGALLGQLHDMWNTDKHRTLIPTTLWTYAPKIKLTNAELFTHPPDRFEVDTYVMEFSVIEGAPPPDPHVDVEPQGPFDIALSDSGRVPVIDELSNILKLVLVGIVVPASEMFPEGAGMRTPWGPSPGPAHWPSPT